MNNIIVIIDSNTNEEWYFTESMIFGFDADKDITKAKVFDDISEVCTAHNHVEHIIDIKYDGLFYSIIRQYNKVIK